MDDKLALSPRSERASTDLAEVIEDRLGLGVTTQALESRGSKSVASSPSISGPVYKDIDLEALKRFKIDGLKAYHRTATKAAVRGREMEHVKAHAAALEAQGYDAELFDIGHHTMSQDSSQHVPCPTCTWCFISAMR